MCHNHRRNPHNTFPRSESAATMPTQAHNPRARRWRTRPRTSWMGGTRHLAASRPETAREPATLRSSRAAMKLRLRPIPMRQKRPICDRLLRPWSPSQEGVGDSTALVPTAARSRIARSRAQAPDLRWLAGRESRAVRHRPLLLRDLLSGARPVRWVRLHSRRRRRVGTTGWRATSADCRSQHQRRRGGDDERCGVGESTCPAVIGRTTAPR